MSDQEVQLKRTNIILSHQDWFLGSTIQTSKQLQAQVDEDTSPETIKTSLQQLQEFVYVGLRLGYDDGVHVWQLLVQHSSEMQRCLPG